jgi:hypothetical protein
MLIWTVGRKTIAARLQAEITDADVIGVVEGRCDRTTMTRQPSIKDCVKDLHPGSAAWSTRSRGRRRRTETAADVTLRRFSPLTTTADFGVP